MSDNSFTIEAPIKGEIKVQVTDGDRIAWVTYSLPIARYPTKAEIDKAISEAVKGAREQIGEDWNIPNAHDFMQNFLEEEYGERFAVPHGKEYDEPYSFEEKGEE